MSDAIVVFAKAPQAGRVKTRMCPPLSLSQAAELYAHLLEDVLAATAEIARDLHLDAVLAVHPTDACADVARDAPACFRVVGQRGRSLGERMSWAVREAAASGASRILLRGSDSPVLDGATVAEARAALDDADLAICPDRDGGYNLIALRGPTPGLFDHPMSTDSALDDTLANAAQRGLRAHLLAPSFDLDTIEDLRWLAAARRESVTKLCRRTVAFLDEAGLWQLAEGG